MPQVAGLWIFNVYGTPNSLKILIKRIKPSRTLLPSCMDACCRAVFSLGVPRGKDCDPIATPPLDNVPKGAGSIAPRTRPFRHCWWSHLQNDIVTISSSLLCAISKFLDWLPSLNTNFVMMPRPLKPSSTHPALRARTRTNANASAITSGI